MKEKNRYSIVDIILDKLYELEGTYTINTKLNTDFDVVIYVGREEYYELLKSDAMKYVVKDGKNDKLYGHDVIMVNQSSYLSIDLRLKNVNKKYKLDAINRYV